MEEPLVQLMPDSKGGCLCAYIMAMDSTCIHCRHQIVPDDGIFLVLSYPYQGCLHRRCAPSFNFNGNWPHPFPYAVYANKGGNIHKWNTS